MFPLYDDPPYIATSLTPSLLWKLLYMFGLEARSTHQVAGGVNVQQNVLYLAGSPQNPPRMCNKKAGGCVINDWEPDHPLTILLLWFGWGPDHPLLCAWLED